MPVAIAQTANPAGVAAVANVCTYADLDIGAAASDRVIVVLCGGEVATQTPNSATINSGAGAVAMTAGTLGTFGNVRARIFRAAVPTGTTATVAVTWSGAVLGTENHIAVYRITGSNPAWSSEGADTSTDMDVTDPLTTGSTVIVADGGMIAVAVGGTDTGAKAWANLGEDLDVDAGVFRFTTAFSTTAGTATRTCTGSNNEDGALAWAIFAPRKELAADAGTYAVTGTDAALEHDKTIAADGGSYAISGTDAAISKGQNLSADAGSYATTGTNAALEHDWISVADADSYTITGIDAATVHAWVVGADVGSYAISGTDAALELAGNPNKTLDADAGTYAVTGTDASLDRTHTISADPASYAISGATVSLEHVWALAADGGDYSVNGTDVALDKGQTLAADAGSYVVSGATASLLHDRTIIASGDSYSINGIDGTLQHLKAVIAESEIYVVSGTDASLVKVLGLTADAGTYAISGADANLEFSGGEAEEFGELATITATVASGSAGVTVTGSPDGQVPQTARANVAAPQAARANVTVNE